MADKMEIRELLDKADQLFDDWWKALSSVPEDAQPFLFHGEASVEYDHNGAVVARLYVGTDATLDPCGTDHFSEDEEEDDWPVRCLVFWSEIERRMAGQPRWPCFTEGQVPGDYVVEIIVRPPAGEEVAAS
jgi:hypothetical protein